MKLPKRADALLQVLSRLAECVPSDMEVRVLKVKGRNVPKRMQVIKKAAAR